MVSGAPRVAVVLPIFNGEVHLRESIDSILAQTFVDFELVLVDDASTDSSLKIAREYEDSRIRVLALQENRGLAAALNAGIAYSSAPVIARQDQDDISHPHRLEYQLELLDREPRIVLVGSHARIIALTEKGEWAMNGRLQHPATDQELRLRLLWNNPFVHSSVAFRRTAFEESGGYATQPGLSLPEDYDLWSRMSAYGSLANIPEELVTYRQTMGGMSEVLRDSIREGVVRIATANLAAASGLAPADPRLKDLAMVLNSVPARRASMYLALERMRTFLRACDRVAPRRTPRLVAVRARWATKILSRSLDPRWSIRSDA